MQDTRSQGLKMLAQEGHKHIPECVCVWDRQLSLGQSHPGLRRQGRGPREGDCTRGSTRHREDHSPGTWPAREASQTPPGVPEGGAGETSFLLFPACSSLSARFASFKHVWELFSSQIDSGSSVRDRTATQWPQTGFSFQLLALAR